MRLSVRSQIRVRHNFGFIRSCSIFCKPHQKLKQVHHHVHGHLLDQLLVDDFIKNMLVLAVVLAGGSRGGHLLRLLFCPVLRISAVKRSSLYAVNVCIQILIVVPSSTQKK